MRWRAGAARGAGRRLTSCPRCRRSRASPSSTHAAFGTDRSAFLEDLLQRPGALSRHDPAGGFLLARRGRTATYIGPVVAAETATALRLLESALAAVSGPVLIDVPDRQSEVTGLLASRGFEVERPFARMALEHDSGFGDPALVRAAAAPELG